MLAEAVVGEAGDQRRRHLGERGSGGPAQIGAAVVAAQRDHAAGVARIGLRCDRDRLELLGVAVPAVDQQAKRVDGVDAALVDQPALRLRHGLAGVEGERARIDAARIGIELCARQAERILCQRQCDVVRDQRDEARVVRAPGQLQVADAALGGAVIAAAIGREAARAGVVAERALRAAQRAAEAQGAVAAAGQAEAQGGWPAAFFGEDLQHTARGVAVERRERPAQHLDAIRRGEVDVRDLALAIGQRGRDAIDEHPHAADAETRARAKAADRDLHVLRVVLPIARQQAGHPAQAFGQVDLRARIAQRVAFEAVDRGGHIERRRIDAGGGDHHRRKRGVGRLRPRAGMRTRASDERQQGTPNAARGRTARQAHRQSPVMGRAEFVMNRNRFRPRETTLLLRPQACPILQSRLHRNNNAHTRRPQETR